MKIVVQVLCYNITINFLEPDVSLEPGFTKRDILQTKTADQVTRYFMKFVESIVRWHRLKSERGNIGSDPTCWLNCSSTGKIVAKDGSRIYRAMWWLRKNSLTNSSLAKQLRSVS